MTGQALRYAMRRLGITATEAQVETLMDAYLALLPFPEVPSALGALAGTPLAILSNGSPRMLEGAVRSSGLAGVFAHVLSVDAVAVYKPSPRVYELAPLALGVEPGEILFVSSNGWDVAGAAAFGFRTCWCNRANAPAEELDATPDYEVDRLDAIADKLGSDDRGLVMRRSVLGRRAGSGRSARCEGGSTSWPAASASRRPRSSWSSPRGRWASCP